MCLNTLLSQKLQTAKFNVYQLLIKSEISKYFVDTIASITWVSFWHIVVRSYDWKYHSELVVPNSFHKRMSPSGYAIAASPSWKMRKESQTWGNANREQWWRSDSNLQMQSLKCFKQDFYIFQQEHGFSQGCIRYISNISNRNTTLMVGAPTISSARTGAWPARTACHERHHLHGGFMVTLYCERMDFQSVAQKPVFFWSRSLFSQSKDLPGMSKVTANTANLSQKCQKCQK